MLPEPGWSDWDFGTDNREAGVPGTSRLFTRVVIDPEKLCTGGSILEVSVGSSGSHRTNRSTGESQFKVGTPSWVRVDGERPCRVGITIIASGSYPFVWVAPAIDVFVHWTVEVIDPGPNGRVAITLDGAHDSFPDYEGLTNGVLIYHYATKGTGPGLNLVSYPTYHVPIVTNYTGYQLWTPTPDCCKRLNKPFPDAR